MKGLIIKSPWIDYILDGKKTWEIRGSNTHIRGEIALIKSGSGMIFGTAELVECKKLSIEEYQSAQSFHCISDFSILPYKNIYAWVLKNPKRLENPIPYKHPLGSVIWVNLEISDLKGFR